MYGFSLKKVADVCGGVIIGDISGADREPVSISIDSRNVRSGDLFAAFRGEQTDGNEYIDAAFRNGAAACITDRRPQEITGTIILVEDVQKSLETLAKEFRNTVSIPFVGITGSVGKTTAKEMISSVLSQKYCVLKTDKNYNNQLGVPITLSRISREHEIAVVEMGVSKIDDMDLLGDIVRPQVGVFTSIGKAHLEYLKDLDGVFTEKTKMLKYMDDDSLAVVNGDDPMLHRIRFKGSVIRCGSAPDSDFKAENIVFTSDGKTVFDIAADEKICDVVIPSFGMHYVSDALLAAAVGKRYGLSGEEIRSGIGSFKNIGGRGDLIRKNGFLIIDDSYNANPESVRSAIDSMMLLPGRHICILGDMLELGEDEIELHAEIGRYASDKGVELMYSAGPLSLHISDSFRKGGKHFEDVNELISEVSSRIRENDIILIKASRGMHFERIAKALGNL
ncbi:MAG: UDP-N-acetylmuramoyl-tripeptide--D-alanyl-D-alanine ligase [Oscillospiraceae bacterium]|nr:UDP-N-acetylmuramoyl-tripeptide--D-alanyl-D-alanine ligase [Oscillospiraceae bacterium]